MRARADHKTLLQLEKDVDQLVAKIKAEVPVEESKALLAEIAVSPHGNTPSQLRCTGSETTSRL